MFSFQLIQFILYFYSRTDNKARVIVNGELGDLVSSPSGEYELMLDDTDLVLYIGMNIITKCMGQLLKYMYLMCRILLLHIRTPSYICTCLPLNPMNEITLKLYLLSVAVICLIQFSNTYMDPDSMSSYKDVIIVLLMHSIYFSMNCLHLLFSIHMYMYKCIYMNAL